MEECICIIRLRFFDKLPKKDLDFIINDLLYAAQIYAYSLENIHIIKVMFSDMTNNFHLLELIVKDIADQIRCDNLVSHSLLVEKITESGIVYVRTKSYKELSWS